RSVHGQWQYSGGGMAFGALSDQDVCEYSVENAPGQPGSDSLIVYGDAGDSEPTQVRVGVRAWSHNDPAAGHPGTDCATPSCFWPVRLLWAAY
ncbi:MAG TPA: hypothetical protein VGP93_00970, partial [Polyangiaceae bacterium]|nr:hypothetical protein [Polyangiaceae bacterium]